MCIRKTVETAALAVALYTCLQAQAIAQSACPDTGPRSATSLTREWILVGWEKHPGDPPFDFDAKLGRFYDLEATAAEVSFYDDFDPQHRLLASARAYGDIWQAPFTSLRSAEHGISMAPKVLRDGSLAAVTMQFVARLITGDGNVIGIRTLSSLTWRCSEKGWKIVREHNSSQRLARDAVDPALASASKER